MDEQLTVRLPADLSRELGQRAKQLRLKRSDVVRLALAAYLEGSGTPLGPKPADRVKALLGSISSELPDLGTEHRRHLAARLGKNA